MHANLPEIAKRWERDYANGGVASQGGMKNYLGEQPMVNAPQNWRSGPDSPPTELAYITQPEKELILRSNIHGSLANGPNEGPSGIMSLDSQGDKGTYGQAGQSYGDQERYTSTDVTGPQNIHGGTTKTIGPTTPKDTFKQSWSGPKGWFGGGGYRNLNVPGDTSQGHQSRFGIGNLFRGAMSMFGGIPGKIGSMLSHINPGKLRGWNEQYGRYNTQDEYEQARTNRRNQKNIERILNRKAPITEMTYKNLARYGMNPEDMPGVGSTPTSRAIDKDYARGMNTYEGPFSRSHLQSLANKQALTNKLSAQNYNFHPSQGGIMSTPQGMDFAGERRAMTQPGLDKFRPMTDQQVQKYGQLSTQNINRGVYDPYGIRTPSGAFSYDMNYNNNVPMDPYADIEDSYAKVVGPALFQMRVLEKKDAMSEYGGEKLTPKERLKLDKLKKMDADPDKVYNKILIG